MGDSKKRKKEDKAKGNNKDGIFLDTIIRKNGVRQLEKFKPSDIKSLKSLLNVSAVTMWLKGSKEQSKMQKDYKNFYKEVSKLLDSLYKHCSVIRKHNTKDKDLRKKIDICNNYRTEIENAIQDAAGKQDAIKKLEDARTPTNIMAIKELNKLTEDFNKLRASDKYYSMITQADVDIYVETYKEFEEKMRMVFRTEDPVVIINQFVQEKKQLKEKESREVSLSVLREKKNDIKVAQRDVSKVLGEFENTLNLGKGSLKKYLVNENDFIAVNNGLYYDLIDALTEKIKVHCKEVDKEEEFKSKVKKEINEYLKKIQEEMKKGSLEVFTDAAKQCAKSLWGFISPIIKYFTGANDEKKDDAEIKKEIEKFCYTWVRFERVHVTLADKINYKEKILNEFLGEYETYIDNIVKASNASNTLEKKYSHLSETLYEMKDNKALSRKRIRDLIVLLNRTSNEINKSVSSLRTKYIAAQSDSEAIKEIIKDYVETYKDKFGNALNGKEISEWKPLKSCSTFTLAQAVLVVYYYVDRYENKRKFGLSDEIFGYLERSEKVKLGITTNEIKEIIGTLEQKRG